MKVKEPLNVNEHTQFFLKEILFGEKKGEGGIEVATLAY